MRYTGVCARGIVAPIFKSGDDLVKMICDSLIEASEQEGFALHDGDILAVTEAVVGRTQGNYATCEQIAADLRAKFGGETLGAVFPILSRNRFAVLLRAIAMSSKKVYVQLSYPKDEVGNALFDPAMLDRIDVNPFSDNFDEAGFRKVFGYETVHPFTGVDYVEFYKSLGDNIEIVFSNDPRHILKYTPNALCCDVHSRARTKALLRAAGANVRGLDDILTESVDGSGFNPDYGLLGSNKATEERVKLFPRDCDLFVNKLQGALKSRTGRHFEVMVYGDGGFKDPQCGIWELDDPVVSPAYTSGLSGTPNELKIKYIADAELSGLSGEELSEALRERIRAKDKNLVGQMVSEGTTPRKLTDLLGSLSDLVSGSGDRGTPAVLIQNYFTNYASE
ncbi:MAG: coenzyme F420-0:L-glutamate ligase [Defluviitaleaceae bacterium]|nr:coenzyme F420-0:L-glutamate ligase [Defluviitaleaceae bacterium]